MNFIIVSNNEIIGNYNELAKSVLTALDYILKTDNMLTNEVTIIEVLLESSTVLNKYFITKDGILDDQNNKIDFTNNILNKYIQQKLSDVFYSTKIFLPIIDNQSQETQVQETEVQETQSLDKLKSLIKMKAEIEQKLKEKEDKIKVEREIINKKLLLENKKKKLKIFKENLTEFNNIFLADKKLYFTFKDDIENNNMKEIDIPILFKNKYPVYKQLDEEKILTSNFDDVDIKESIRYKELIKNNDNIVIPSAYDNIFYCTNLNDPNPDSEIDDSEIDDSEIDDSDDEDNEI